MTSSCLAPVLLRCDPAPTAHYTPSLCPCWSPTSKPNDEEEDNEQRSVLEDESNKQRKDELEQREELLHL
jgi:hypothetical protein